MSRLTLSQFKAILYADVFDYPLTFEEAKKFEIRSTKSETNSKQMKAAKQMRADRKRLPAQAGMEADEEYYFLKGRKRLVEIRKKREKYSEEKLKIAKRVGQWLKIIPSITMIAVTGAVAANNAKEDDDIDLMIVSCKNSVWTTRFLSIVLVEILGKRRRPDDKDFKNKICLNMFLDEENLAVTKKERDLFSAHEAAQVKVIFSKNKMEEKWWRENGWVKKYLPNFKFQISNFKFQISNFLNFICRFSFFIFHFSFVEKALQKIQLAYMNSKRTQEVIAPGYLRFHPQDAREWVMREYGKRLRKYGLE